MSSLHWIQFLDFFIFYFKKYGWHLDRLRQELKEFSWISHKEVLLAFILLPKRICCLDSWHTYSRYKNTNLHDHFYGLQQKLLKDLNMLWHLNSCLQKIPSNGNHQITGSILSTLFTNNLQHHQSFTFSFIKKCSKISPIL